MDYVAHNCKNPKCDNGWIDEDLTNSISRPPSWKYCQECCEKYGYINPTKPIKKEQNQEQLDNLQKGREKLAAKRNKLPD